MKCWIVSVAADKLAAAAVAASALVTTSKQVFDIFHLLLQHKWDNNLMNEQTQYQWLYCNLQHTYYTLLMQSTVRVLHFVAIRLL